MRRNMLTLYPSQAQLKLQSNLLKRELLMLLGKSSKLNSIAIVTMNIKNKKRQNKNQKSSNKQSNRKSKGKKLPKNLKIWKKKLQLE